MQLRTARRGERAGHQFYGCTRFPACRGIVDVEDNEDSKAEIQIPATPKVKMSLPRRFSARPLIEGYQAQFFQSVAVSEHILAVLRVNELVTHTRRSFAQWRLDYPIPDRQPELDERQVQVLSVALKILTRGSITLCSPDIEVAFQERFLGTADIPQNGLLEKTLSIFPQIKADNVWLDSPIETLFYNKYLPETFGHSFMRWVCPQVELNSLISAEFSPQQSGRVDFLICHPNHEKVIVEIDGDHTNQQELDVLRDSALSQGGYRVIRILSSEVEKLSGVGLTMLEDMFGANAISPVNDISKNDKVYKYITALKLSHQIQISLVHAMWNGFLPISDSTEWHISSDLFKAGYFTKSESLFVLSESINDLQSLLQTLGRLYSIQICNGISDIQLGYCMDGIHIAFVAGIQSSQPTFLIQDISVPLDIASSILESTPAILDAPSQSDLEYFLGYLFRHTDGFWEGQFDAITRTLQGKDSIVLLPTGAGKSIIFQLASLLLPGIGLVVEPIIALMDDQVDNLQRVGIDRVIAISSEIDDSEDLTSVLTLFGQAEYLLAYISPERFQIVDFRKKVHMLTTHSPVALIAIDEAHCISEWGHNFRTAYLNIGRTSRSQSEMGGVIPPLVALTGTASRSVLKDIERELQIVDFEARVTPKSFERSNLHFHIDNAPSSNKAVQLLGYLEQNIPSFFRTSTSTFYQTNKNATYSGLVFCPHVNGSFGIVEIERQIRRSLGIQTRIYSGSAPKTHAGAPWNRVKQAAAKSFKDNEFPVLVCTNAFGMGIDKPNIRYTIHFGIPLSIEAFYQEAGRAGRDNAGAHCVVLASIDDPQRARSLLDPNTNMQDLSEVIKRVNWGDNDDITRALYFHTQAFPGIGVEKKRVEQTIQLLANLSVKATKTVKYRDLDRVEAEKALHRNLLLGIISDYTINYNTYEFTIILAGCTRESIIASYGNYVAGYIEARRQTETNKASRLPNLSLSEFALEMVDLLLRFIYDVIERGRRQALSAMFELATRFRLGKSED